MSLRQKAKELGIPYSTYLYRVNQGWVGERLATPKLKPSKGYKICSVCHQEKTYIHFYKRYNRNGFHSRCKECAKKATPKGG